MQLSYDISYFLSIANFMLTKAFLFDMIKSMIVANALTNYTQEVTRMSRELVLVSRVPELLEAKGWSVNEFTGRCLLAGLSADTARRLARGDTKFNSETLAVAAKVFGLDSISDVVDIKK